MSEHADDAAPISRAEMRDRVAHAVATERFMCRLGWLVLALAVTGLVVTVVLWLHEDIGVEQALAAVFGVIITGILSGAAAYSSGVNIGLGASRLSLAMEDQAGESESPAAAE
jgi:hypothetical protein